MAMLMSYQSRTADNRCGIGPVITSPGCRGGTVWHSGNAPVRLDPIQKRMRHANLFTAILAPVLALAQPQFVNPGFENWQNLGTGTEEPTDWSSIKTSDASALINNLAPQVCWRSTDFHSGTYSVRLKSVNTTIGVVANGTLTCGRVHAEFTPSNGYVFTDAGNADWNQALTSKPDSLIGWFKATPQPGDKGKVEAILHTGAGQLPEGSTFPNWNARARWIAPSATVGSWTRFSVPFHYYNAGTPSHILLVLTSGDSLVTQENTEAWYDDIGLVYNIIPSPSVSSVALNGIDPAAITVGYSTGGIPVASTLFTAQLSNASGGFGSPVTIGTLTGTSASGTINCSIPGNTAPGAGYRIRVIASNSAYAPVPVPFSITGTSTVKLAAKVRLEGAYVPSTGSMGDALRTLPAFPLTEPYSALGYAHVAGGGETTTAPVLAVTGNNAIVDWVVLELRSTSSPYAVLATRSALLQRDGDVVDVDGVSPVSLSAGAGNYRVAVRHRNHLGCMTASAVSLSSTPATLDFSAAATSTYGTAARKSIAGAFPTQALWAGDVTFNGQVKYTGSGNDRDPILITVGSSAPNNVVTGTYSGRDVNLNGEVKYTGSGNDRDPILVNVGGTAPNNVRSQQLP